MISKKYVRADREIERESSRYRARAVRVVRVRVCCRVLAAAAAAARRVLGCPALCPEKPRLRRECARPGVCLRVKNYGTGVARGGHGPWRRGGTPGLLTGTEAAYSPPR
jgi:hypothetical protein